MPGCLRACERGSCHASCSGSADAGWRASPSIFICSTGCSSDADRAGVKVGNSVPSHVPVSKVWLSSPAVGALRGGGRSVAPADSFVPVERDRRLYGASKMNSSRSCSTAWAPSPSTATSCSRDHRGMISLARPSAPGRYDRSVCSAISPFQAGRPRDGIRWWYAADRDLCRVSRS